MLRIDYLFTVCPLLGSRCRFSVQICLPSHHYEIRRRLPQVHEQGQRAEPRQGMWRAENLTKMAKPLVAGPAIQEVNVRNLADQFFRASKSLASDQRGNVAITFALVAVPLLIAMGCAVDYSIAATSKTKVQGALDSAVLAAARTTGGVAAQTEVFNNIFSANMAEYKVAGNASNLTPSLTANSDGSLAAKVTASVPTSLMQIVGISSIPVTVTNQTAATESPKTPTTATFQMKVAKGSYWKRLTLYIVDAYGKTQQIAQWVYQPFNMNYNALLDSVYYDQLVNLSWSMNNTFYGNSDSRNGIGTLIGPTTPVTLGLNYKDAYLTMEIMTDGCSDTQVVDTANSGPDLYGNGYNPLRCKNGATRSPSWTYATNTKVGTAHLVKFAGSFSGTRSLFPDTQPFVILVPCTTPATTSYYGFEDSSDPVPASLSNLPASNKWASQDFFFSVTANTCDANQNQGQGNGIARLAK